MKSGLARLRSSALGAILVPALLGVAACGGSDDDDDTLVEAGAARDGGAGLEDATTADASAAPDGGADAASSDATVTSDAAAADSGTDGAVAVDGSSDAGDAGDAADAADAADAGPLSMYSLYDADQVPTFSLTIDPANIAILSNTDVASEDDWAAGDLVMTSPFGTETFPNVGIRRKGSSTFRALPQKAALKIKFNKNVKGQKFHGLEEVTLNNMVSDGTFLAERLAYYVFRSAGLPASLANTASLTINGDSYGIYANVESINDDFTARTLGASAKTDYESNGGGDWVPGEENNFDIQVGSDYSDLTVLFTTVTAAKSGTLLTDVAKNLDTTEFLKFCALERLVGQIDGYAYGIEGSHNNDLEGDVNDLFRLVPWSLDETFSDNNGVVDLSKPLPADVGENDPTLLGRCKLDATCWATYKTTVSSMATFYDSLDLATLALTWHDQINALALADPKKVISNDGYVGETNKLYPWIRAQTARAKGQLGLP